MTVDALQDLANEIIKDKEATENLTSINLKLSQRLTQAQEDILALSKKLHTLQEHMNTKKTCNWK